MVRFHALEQRNFTFSAQFSILKYKPLCQKVSSFFGTELTVSSWADILLTLVAGRCEATGLPTSITIHFKHRSFHLHKVRETYHIKVILLFERKCQLDVCLKTKSPQTTLLFNPFFVVCSSLPSVAHCQHKVSFGKHFFWGHCMKDGGDLAFFLLSLAAVSPGFPKWVFQETAGRLQGSEAPEWLSWGSWHFWADCKLLLWLHHSHGAVKCGCPSMCCRVFANVWRLWPGKPVWKKRSLH